jgi:hypothetical protein
VKDLSSFKDNDYCHKAKIAELINRRNHTWTKRLNNLSATHQMIILDDIETAIDERLKVFEKIEERSTNET